MGSKKSEIYDFVPDEREVKVKNLGVFKRRNKKAIE